MTTNASPPNHFAEGKTLVKLSTPPQNHGLRRFVWVDTDTFMAGVKDGRVGKVATKVVDDADGKKLRGPVTDQAVKRRTVAGTIGERLSYTVLEVT